VARVFVSHASEDYVAAAELHQWLLEDGHEVFLNQDLRRGIGIGEEWEQRLYAELTPIGTVSSSVEMKKFMSSPPSSDRRQMSPIGECCSSSAHRDAVNRH
jgi:hypothetical protein